MWATDIHIDSTQSYSVAARAVLGVPAGLFGEGTFFTEVERAREVETFGNLRNSAEMTF